MTPSLEAKLAKIIEHIDQLGRSGACGRTKLDQRELERAVQDAEVSAWLRTHVGRGILVHGGDLNRGIV